MIKIMNKLKIAADEILHIHFSHYYYESSNFDIYNDSSIGGAGLDD